MTKKDEVRVAVSSELKQKLIARYQQLGVTETEYVRSLIIEDMKHG